MKIARNSAKTLKDYQKHISQIKKAHEKERDALKRTRTIIAKLQECGGE